MNLEEESILDLIKADKIDKKVMSDIKITAYKINRVETNLKEIRIRRNTNY
jgi:hypothetical protein